jgi:hypothetical protein
LANVTNTYHLLTQIGKYSYVICFPLNTSGTCQPAYWTTSARGLPNTGRDSTTMLFSCEQGVKRAQRSISKFENLPVEDLRFCINLDKIPPPLFGSFAEDPLFDEDDAGRRPGEAKSMPPVIGALRVVEMPVTSGLRLNMEKASLSLPGFSCTTSLSERADCICGEGRSIAGGGRLIMGGEILGGDNMCASLRPLAMLSASVEVEGRGVQLASMDEEREEGLGVLIRGDSV